MRIHACVLSASLWLALPTLVPGADRCLPLPSDTAKAITAYIQKKYELPPTTQVELQSAAAVEGTCYRKLRIRTIPARGGASQMVLFLTPDQQFLTRDLMDVRVDPEQSKRQEEQALRSELNSGRFPTRGTKDAPVTITIFSDFQCPYCRRAAEMINDDILPRVSNPVKLVYRYLPLPIHPWARTAAELASCAYQQNEVAFWRVHDFLFTQQSALTVDNLRKRVEDLLAEAPDIDMQAFGSCATGREASASIDQDLSFAEEHDIRVTPTIFVNGVRRNGLVNLDEMRQLISAQTLRP